MERDRNGKTCLPQRLVPSGCYRPTNELRRSRPTGIDDDGSRYTRHRRKRVRDGGTLQLSTRTATHAVPKSHQRQNHSFGTENITRCWYSRSFAQRAGRQAFRLCSTIPAAIFSNIRRRKRSRPFLQDQPPGIQQKATPEIILRSVFSFLYLVRHLNRFFTESANKLLFSRNLLSITLSVYRLFGLLAPIESGWFWAGINRRIR